MNILKYVLMAIYAIVSFTLIGLILKQNKEEKTKVDEGTVVTITVNKIKTTEKPNENTITNTNTNTTTTNTVNSNVITNTMQS